MKRVFFPLLLLVFSIARAAEPPAPLPAPQHVEFKYYGFYCVVDYAHMMCLTNFSGQYMEPHTGQVIGFHDRYNLDGISAVAGWQWRKETALGLGFTYFNDPQKSFSQIPVFVEFRSHYLRSRLTPFTSLQIGYTIPLGTKNLAEEYIRVISGGIAFAVNIGLRFAVKQKFGLNIYGGYQMTHLNSVERGFNGVAGTRMSELYDNFKFGLGVNF